MKTISASLPSDIRLLKIHVFADLHIGDPLCDIKHIQERIESLASDPQARFVINGDILNNAIRGSVSDVYGEALTPMQQLNLAVHLFEPVADKCLAITEGNHERRTSKEVGVNLMQIVSDELGLRDKYSPTSALLFIRFGRNSRRHSENRKMCYTVFLTHGAGGGKNTSGKSAKLEALNQIVDADVFVRSHTHEPIAFKTSFFRTSIENNSVTQVDRLFVNTAAEMDYGGYGEVAEYTPASKQNPVIVLDGTHRAMFATI